jgi:nucleoside-diphosphate-sugar epimerase
MKLFLTGGTGFVGSHFISEADARGHEIVALRRPGSLPRIPLRQEPRWIDGTLDADHTTALQGAEVFVHLAAHTPNPPYDSLDRCLYWNVYAALKLADQAYSAGVRKFLIAGSCFEYGRAAERYPAIPADAPLEPVLSYPISKAAASVAFLGMARQMKLQLQVLRIFQVYGEGEQASRFWPSLKAAALAGKDFPMSAGTQVRDFVPVEEVARQFADALRFDGIEAGEPRVAHVATGHSETLLEFAERWWASWKATGRLLPGAVPPRAGEIMRLVPEIS